jgi:hypothetical protein
MTRPVSEIDLSDIRQRNARIEQWVLRAQLVVFAVVVLVAAGTLALVTDRAAQGVTDCRALRLPQCPEFLK